MIKTREVWAEAWRDIATGTSRTLIFVTLTCALLSALVLADTMAVGALVRDAREYQARGASVMTVTASAGIDGAGCERLNELPAVQSAGALRASASPVVAALLPAAPLPVYEVTLGMLNVFDVDRRGMGGVSVPTDVVQSLSVDVGESISATGGTAIPVDGTYKYPADGRRPGFAWALLATTPAEGTYDECWVKVWPSQPDLRTLVLSTALTVDFSASGGQALESQLNTQLGTTFDGHAKFVDRATRLTPLIAAVIGVALGLLSVRLRRLELAARLHDGLGKGHLHQLMLLEGASWFVPAAAISAAAGAVYSTTVGFPDAVALFATAATTPILGALGAALGTIAGVHLVRERQLFAYFKDR
ncbi:hypothetical protein [Microbacterium sp. CJ88]|uniref:hypothetical protein n=1 Tax=Microbacterium sp. CJ88 TaxID=3445672 RepID=UPI003F65AA0C